MYGRRWVYILSTAFFLVMTVPVPSVKSLGGIISLRFLAAVGSSGIIALAPGTLGDIANDDQRALAYSIWSLGPFTAPAIGPIFGGFTVQYLGWRWLCWIEIIAGRLGLLLLLFVQESYPPVLLQRKAAFLRNTTGNEGFFSRFDERSQGLPQRLLHNLTRPFILSFTEHMLLAWNLYVELIYGILYLSFTAFPVVFEGARGWNTSL